MQRRACGLVVGQCLAQQRFGEMLALVHRQLAARNELCVGCAPGTFRRVHTTGLGYRALEDPVGQRCAAERLAGVNVFLDHVGHFQPAGLLPQLERALLHAKTPAHGLVHIAGRFGNGGQVHGRVMEAVAQNGPQKLALRAFGIAQELEALGSRLFQHAAIHLVGLLAAGHVLFGFQVKPQNVTADLLVEPCLGFLAQIAQVEQLLQDGRRAKALVERVGFQVQVVLQRLDNVRHGVQTHHVRGAEGATRCTSELLAGQVVHHVEREAEFFDLLHRRQHAGNAHAVSDEVGRVVCAHHALAQAAGHKGFELVEHFGGSGGGVDQLHQRHVARRVEEVDAAKARLDVLGQRFGELRDRQARGVRGDDGVRVDERRDLFVQIELPVHALGNRLNDEVAVAQLLQVLFVVGLTNQRGIIGHAQRRGLEFLEAFHRARDDAIFRTFLGRQVKQHHRHFDVDQVRGNLRTHHACAENGDFFNLKSRHVLG